jgi:hypothetical protein
MIGIYARKVNNGTISLDEVPERYREQVKERIEEEKTVESEDNSQTTSKYKNRYN